MQAKGLGVFFGSFRELAIHSLYCHFINGTQACSRGRLHKAIMSASPIVCSKTPGKRCPILLWKMSILHPDT